MVYLGDVPVATLRPNGAGGITAYYVHTDHLNTIRKISRSSDNLLVWRGDSDPFENTPANENPSGLGTFVSNLAFPGQYLDSEVGIYYNYFRDYNPATGRYVQSDPIGLAGGSFSTYAYVEGNPVSRTDRLGLADEEEEDEEEEIEQAIVQSQVQFLLSQIQQYDPSYEYQTARPSGSSPDSRDVQNLQDILRQYRSQSSCPAPGLPPLRRIHSPQTLLNSLHRDSYDYWNLQPTTDIINSLAPGAADPLTVPPLGGLWMGTPASTFLSNEGSM